MDELPPRARALLDVARDTDEPTDADRVRIDGRFRALLAGFGLPALPPLVSRAAAETSPAAAAAAGAGGGGLGGGLTLAASLASAMVVGVGALWSLSDASAPAATLPKVVAPVTVVTPSAAPPSPPIASSAVTVPVTAPAPAQPAPAPRSSKPRHARARSSAAPMTAGDLEREVQMVGDANRALSAGRPGQALEVLERHAAAFPKGLLREERRAMRVLALCELGRLDEGRREKRRLLARAPGGVLASRLRDACLVPTGESTAP